MFQVTRQQPSSQWNLTSVLTSRAGRPEGQERKQRPLSCPASQAFSILSTQTEACEDWEWKSAHG